MIPTVVGFSGVCGICGISPEALTREKVVSCSKFCFLNVLTLKETPPTPQTPQPACRVGGDILFKGSGLRGLQMQAGCRLSPARDAQLERRVRSYAKPTLSGSHR
jgi:hypothetical protein